MRSDFYDQAAYPYDSSSEEAKSANSKSKPKKAQSRKPPYLPWAGPGKRVEPRPLVKEKRTRVADSRRHASLSPRRPARPAVDSRHRYQPGHRQAPPPPHWWDASPGWFPPYAYPDPHWRSRGYEAAWLDPEVKGVDVWFDSLRPSLKDGSTALITGDPELAQRRAARRLTKREAAALASARRHHAHAAEEWVDSLLPPALDSPSP